MADGFYAPQFVEATTLSKGVAWFCRDMAWLIAKFALASCSDPTPSHSVWLLWLGVLASQISPKRANPRRKYPMQIVQVLSQPLMLPGPVFAVLRVSIVQLNRDSRVPSVR